jgi:hypothetical protein
LIGCEREHFHCLHLVVTAMQTVQR